MAHLKNCSQWDMKAEYSYMSAIRTLTENCVWELLAEIILEGSCLISNGSLAHLEDNGLVQVILMYNEKRKKTARPCPECVARLRQVLFTKILPKPQQTLLRLEPLTNLPANEDTEKPNPPF